MMARKIGAVVFLCLALATAVFIFCRSARDGTASSGESTKVTEAVAPIVVPSYPTQSGAQQRETVKQLHGKVRSFAHALEFSALGFCLTAALWLWPAYPLRASLSFLVSFPVSALYALSDEIHQRFVPGRAFEWTDMGLDALGAAAGCFLAVALLLIMERIARLHRTLRAKHN